jgi:hypothetical protein
MPPAAWAHGGEDHGAPAAPRAAVVGAEHVAAGETDLFSVVVKYPASKGNGPVALRVYVARAETSAPIADAAIHLQLKGGVTLEQDGARTDVPGIYELSFPAPPDGVKANAVVSVQAKEDFDLVLVGDLSFGPSQPQAPPSVDRPHGPPSWLIISGAGALAVVTGAIGFALGRRSRSRLPPPGDRAHDPALPQVTP